MPQSSSIQLNAHWEIQGSSLGSCNFGLHCLRISWCPAARYTQECTKIMFWFFRHLIIMRWIFHFSLECIWGFISCAVTLFLMIDVLSLCWSLGTQWKCCVPFVLLECLQLNWLPASSFLSSDSPPSSLTEAICIVAPAARTRWPLIK